MLPTFPPAQPVQQQQGQGSTGLNRRRHEQQAPVRPGRLQISPLNGWHGQLLALAGRVYLVLKPPGSPPLSG